MNVVNKRIDEITPYENNPRNNDVAVEYVANSIKSFGFKVPIVIDENNVIVTGHTRLKAAKQLGMEEVPCVIADDLTADEIKAFRLADNKVAEFSLWDNDALTKELSNIEDINMDLFGFIDEELNEPISKQEEKPEVEFSEILGEENNFIVLQFKTDIDWLQALSVFDIKEVRPYSTRKDGKITKGMEKRIGVGRVLDGAKAIEKLMGGVDNEYFYLLPFLQASSSQNVRIYTFM